MIFTRLTYVFHTLFGEYDREGGGGLHSNTLFMYLSLRETILPLSLTHTHASPLLFFSHEY